MWIGHYHILVNLLQGFSGYWRCHDGFIRHGYRDRSVSCLRTLGQTAGIAVLGAFWAARTSFYTGTAFTIGPSHGHIGAQLHALHDTITAVIIIIGFSVFLSIWSILIERLRGPEA